MMVYMGPINILSIPIFNSLFVMTNRQARLLCNIQVLQHYYELLISRMNLYRKNQIFCDRMNDPTRQDVSKITVVYRCFNP